MIAQQNLQRKRQNCNYRVDILEVEYRSDENSIFKINDFTVFAPVVAVDPFLDEPMQLSSLSLACQSSRPC